MLILSKIRCSSPKLLIATKRLYSPFPASNHYDIIIAGGGMVGTTLACTLGSSLLIVFTTITLYFKLQVKINA